MKRSKPNRCDLGTQQWREQHRADDARIEHLRQLCWQTAGVDRVVQGLRQALQQVQAEESWLEKQPLLQLVKDLDHAETFELGDSSRRNLNLLLDLHHRLLTSRLMLEAGLFRRESRGGHFRIDAPVAAASMAVPLTPMPPAWDPNPSRTGLIQKSRSPL